MFGLGPEKDLFEAVAPYVYHNISLTSIELCFVDI